MQPTLFGSLNTAYSGLQVAQLQTQTVSTNISNSDTPGYSRQVAVVQTAKPLNVVPGEVGLGAQVTTIARVHDQYVYNRLCSATTNQAFTGMESDTLKEVSQYFPDLQNNGISADLDEFFKAWQSFANTPGDQTQAIAVTSKTQTLCTSINQAYQNITDVQKNLNDQMQAVVDEINGLAAKIASLNKQIGAVEANGVSQANDLKDQRDDAVLTLNGLVNVSVSNGSVDRTPVGGSNMVSDNPTQEFVIQAGGYPLVDGGTFQPLVIKQAPGTGDKPFNSVYFQNQNYVDIDITSKLNSGKLGAILDLRGYDLNSKGVPTKGKLQDYLNSLNTFSNGLMESVNNIYGQSAMPSAASSPISDPTGSLTLSALGLHVTNGKFDYTVYDKSGKAVATRSISVNPDQDTMQTLAGKFNAQVDDNLDGNVNDDSNKLFVASYVPGVDSQFQINPTNAAAGKGYTIAFNDSSSNPTNFAGALGFNKVFQGSSAGNIALSSYLTDNPSELHAYGAPVIGDNSVANNILNLQNQSVTFYNADGSTTNTTLQTNYNNLVTTINADASAADTSNTTITSVLKAVTNQYESISKVSVDEELVNLMKFQNAYGANAKVLSTIDQMINTLLGIKQ